MTETQTRSRTFDWADPLANGAELIGRSGIELFRMMISGELPPPPIMKLLDMERMEAVEGSVTVYMRAQEFHYNPLGGVHGGVIATLLDTAAACSVHSTLPPGVGYTSLDLTTKFLRPVTVASGLLRCTGSVLSKGRRTALAQAQLFDEQERLLAHATS
ncbi:MAG: PaaI family thioesterase, partial [Catenulispora sp.]|nr:PaaI family thioesterase [Catenulispora sp.]